VTALPSIIFGSILTFEAILPFLTWQFLRSEDIEKAFVSNPWYTRAWKWMYISHYLIFGLGSVLWPFTYLNSQVVNDFYILENFWVSLILGTVFVTINTVLFMMAYASYKPTELFSET